jgi:hypothetical protein
LNCESGQTICSVLYEKDAEKYGVEDAQNRPDVKLIWRKEEKYLLLDGLKKGQNSAW